MGDESIEDRVDEQSRAEYRLFTEAYALFVGSSIRSVRGALGYNQIVFSQNCHISTRTLCKIEAGIQTGDITPLFKIAGYLKKMGIKIGIKDERLIISYPTDLHGGEYQDIMYGLETDDIFSVKD